MKITSTLAAVALAGGTLLGAADGAPTLRYELEIVPGVDDITADGVKSNTTSTVVGGFGLLQAGTFGDMTTYAVDADTTYGLGITAEYVHATPGPVGLAPFNPGAARPCLPTIVP